MNVILIGKAVKPQGIKGELKVLPLADSPEIFLDLKKVYIDGAEYKIVSARIADGVYIVLRGVADRNAAEVFRDKDIYADRQDVPVSPDRWFIADILGCAVCFENGEEIGHVTDIVKRGSTDIYTVAAPSGKAVTFPFLKSIIVKVDINGREITLKKDKFSEVALYED